MQFKDCMYYKCMGGIHLLHCLPGLIYLASLSLINAYADQTQASKVLNINPAYTTTAQLLQSQDRRITSIKGDGNCLFRALSLMVYGTEMLHAKVRELLVAFVRNNANKFRVYVTEGSLEDHILNMQYTRIWGTQVELYAVASLFQKEIYIFTPTLRKDGMYTWIKIPPYPPHVELVFPPRDEPWPRLLDEIDHVATTTMLYGLLMDFTPL